MFPTEVWEFHSPMMSPRLTGRHSRAEVTSTGSEGFPAAAVSVHFPKAAERVTSFVDNETELVQVYLVNVCSVKLRRNRRHVCR